MSVVCPLPLYLPRATETLRFAWRPTPGAWVAGHSGLGKPGSCAFVLKLAFGTDLYSGRADLLPQRVELLWVDEWYEVKLIWTGFG